MTLAGFLRNERSGVAALEFAVFAQIFALIFAGTADIGLVLMKRMMLNDTIAAASNYALVNQAKVSAANGAALATSLAAIITGTGATAVADTVVVIDNGPQRSVTNSVAAASGTAANADQCYCPTGSTTIVWGSSTTCGSACASGLRAGKFVQITASRAHTPLFSNYGIVHSGTISVTTLVQTG